MKRPAPSVKVCGVRDARIAALAARLGARYVGMIFAESPRRVSVAQATAVAAAARSPHCEPVGVFTDSSVDEIDRVATEVGFKIVQLHRRAAAEDVAALHALGYEVWTLAGGAEGDGVLFDSSHGDGETALRRVAGKAILAGGVTAGNLGSALASGADVIDVSGSLESSPGVKDPLRIESFFSKFRSAQREG
ncbi:MAG: phosphoribosylanthranilate isomerase [Kiritimatiellae bacterium]|nr:phosphoribosylanthranilate isomerase [Kiritimatiellia bacterium]